MEDPVIIAPGCMYSEGTGFEGHAFFEAPSIRKIGDTYYFVYSSEVMHELCYATSKSPREGFKYGGVIVSNGDIGISSYKPAEMNVSNTGNNHGSIVEINGEWYIFYHRQTNGTWFSRQGCAEKIKVLPDGSIPQVEMTSCGLNGGPLEGRGEFPAYLACNIFNVNEGRHFGNAKIVQDGRDGDEEIGYVAGIGDGTTVGFKYLDCKGVSDVRITARGYMHGKVEVRTEWNGPVLGEIRIESWNIWHEFKS